MDVDQSNKELDEFEIRALENNEMVKSLITSTNNTFREIKVGGSSVRIKQYMPKKVRTQTLKIGRTLEHSDGKDIEGVEETIYPIVAGMCVDEPFTKESTWRYIDEIEDVFLTVAISKKYKVKNAVRH